MGSLVKSNFLRLPIVHYSLWGVVVVQ